MQPDGRTFYYADYNNIGQRIYSVHRWPCCSGTFPQVVADYGINTYLHEPGAVWVVLYHPSEVRLTESAADISLMQQGTYPLDGSVHLRMQTSRPAPLTLHLRVPQWAGPPRVKVNGRALAVTVDAGFAPIRRQWRNGDTVDVEFSMPLRLEELPPNGGPAHPEAVSLLYGPLVLFAVRQAGEIGPLALSREALLTAQRTGPAEWTVNSPSGPRTFVPFRDLDDRRYTTYLQAV